MKSFFALAAFAAGSNALVGRTDGCCFHLTASGGASGALGQLGDGQNRIGDNSLSPATFCIDSSGGITDSSGRGCILTPPTTQFQCDEGATPTTGFSVSSSGQLMFQGSTSFIACETGQNGGMNIYTTNSSAVTQCKSILLNADSCSGTGVSPVGSSPAAASSTPVASVSPVKSTPAGSAPASSAPAPSIPAGSTPAGSAPASSAPLPGAPITVVSTVTVSACSCPATSAPGAPAPAPSSVAPAPSSSAPAPSGSAPIPSSGAPAPSGSAPVPSSGAPAPSGSAPAPKPSSSFSSVPVPSGSVSPSAPASQPSGTRSVPASSVSATPSAASATGACPTTLSSGSFEFPHLIIPINSHAPNTAFGTQFNGTVTSTISSIFNFDIPSSDSGKTCSLVFLFPQKADLQTSSFSFSGNGNINVAQLSQPASSSTTFHNAPSIMKNLGAITVSPGNNNVISTFSCPAGQTVAYEMKNAGTTDLNFFEDFNPSPIGLFITVC